MILLLDTSTAVCGISFAEGETIFYRDKWEAGRDLSKGLLKYTKESLAKNDLDWKDITGIVVNRGPGSFTGLRIGITVANTLAYSGGLPIVGETGDNWQKVGLGRLADGQDDQLVVPLYGAEANITKPRK